MDRCAHVLRGLGQLAAVEPDHDEDLRAEDDPLQDVNLSRVDEQDKSDLVDVWQAEPEEENSRRDNAEKLPKSLASALRLACQLLQVWFHSLEIFVFMGDK